MKTPPTIGPVTKLTNFPWVNIYSVELQSADAVRHWTFAAGRNTPQLSSRVVSAVGLVVIVKGSVDRLVVVREFRPVVGGFQFSLPFGGIEKGEDVAAAAVRELQEETGLTLSRIHHTSPAVSGIGAGIAVKLVYGEATGEISDAGLEEHEYIETHLLTYAQAERLLRAPSADEFMSMHLYLALVGFITAGSFAFPRG